MRTLRRGSFVLPRLLFTQLPARLPAGSLSAWPASSSVALSCQVSPRLCSTRYRAGNIVAKTQGIVMPTVVSQRVSVTPQVQSAPFGESAPAECAFPHLGKRRAASRKSALCTHRLTERRSLCRLPHGKTHFAQPAGCRMRFSVRHGCVMRFSVRVGHLECAFPSHRARRMRFSVECAFPHLGKRRAVSRKGALCTHRLTERRSLCRPPHGKTHFAQPAGCRMRFSVRRRLQDVSFRNSRLGCRRQGWPLLSVGSAAVQPQGELRKV